MGSETLADIIVEIFDGVTVLDSSFGLIHVKHFHQLETRKTLAKRKRYISEAKKRGLMSEEESLNILIESKMWDPEDETRIQEKRDLIKRLGGSLVNIKIPSHKEQHKKYIKEQEDSLAQTCFERDNLIGLTAEKYVDKKLNQEFFENLLYSDENFKHSVFDGVDFNERDKFLEISNLQSKFFERMSDKNISTAVLSSFFSPYLPFAEDVLGVFGSPLKDLTSFQLKMITYARSFLNVFKNCRKEIPENVAKDPELLVDFFESQKDQSGTTKKASDGSGGSTYFGASKEDIEVMKKDNENTVQLSEEIKKEGGSLNMEEMMKLHGL